MAQDRWRDEDRRRWEEDERRRFGQEGYGQGRSAGRERYGDEERSGGYGVQGYGQGREYGRERYGQGESYGGHGGQEYRQGREYGRERYDQGEGFSDYLGQESGQGREYERPRYGEGEGFPGRSYRGFEPTGYPGTGGFGYIPSQYPEERRFGGEYGRNYGGSDELESRRGRYGNYGEDWSGRGYDEMYPQRGGQERGWWDRAKDEVYSWMGDEDAERRRRADEAQRGHYGRGPKGYTRSDERIREDVSDRLTDDWLIDASNIEVLVVDCEVTLTGSVDSRDAKRRAEDMAESVSGVKNVQNNLRVQQPTESTSAFGTSATGTRMSTGTGAETTGTSTSAAGTTSSTRSQK
jgi:osmotically-inducible protein OsmY